MLDLQAARQLTVQECKEFDELEAVVKELDSQIDAEISKGFEELRKISEQLPQIPNTVEEK